MPTLCKWTARELNHSVGGNWAEYESICRVFWRPLRRNRRDNSDGRCCWESCWDDDVDWFLGDSGDSAVLWYSELLLSGDGEGATE